VRRKEEVRAMTVGELYVVGMGLALVAVFVTGRKLKSLKKARNTIVLTAHKILSLSAVALLVVIAYRASRASQLGTSDWIAVFGAGFFWVIAVVSGGLAAAQRDPGGAIRVLHRVASILTALASGLALYVLLVHV
jgi:hypothetical protein